MLSRIIRRTFSTGPQLLTWGATTYGWARPPSKDIWTPAKADVPDNIVSVFTGEYHMGFLTADNSAYVCGLEDGQTNSETPRKIDIEGNPKIVSLSCGNSHTVALAEDGSVYTWTAGPSTL